MSREFKQEAPTGTHLEIEVPDNPARVMDFWGIAPDGDSDPDTTFSESGRFDFAAAENTIINVCQLVDGFKGFAETDGDWSEWDQATYNALQSLLVSVSKQNSSGQQP